VPVAAAARQRRLAKAVEPYLGIGRDDGAPFVQGNFRAVFVREPVLLARDMQIVTHLNAPPTTLTDHDLTGLTD
jgi:hypothetical protein